LRVKDSAVVVVSGEPGIGKTALISEVLRRAEGLGHHTLSARASEFERDLPFLAFADAFEDALGSLPPARRASLDDEQLAFLATLFPSLSAFRAEGRRHVDPDERHLLLRALHQLLQLLASTGPLVLALDDLQWADPASIDLVCRLLHRGLSGRTLLIFASRPGQSETRLQAAFADAERHGQALRMELGPLSAADVRVILGDDVGLAQAESLHRESGGNPFYLEQLAIAGGSKAVMTGQSAYAQPWVPKQVSIAIKNEIDGLCRLARELLQGAAVVGDPFEPEPAAEAAGLEAPAALGCLDYLLERDLIRVTASPRRFCFRHPIVRHAVYEAAGAGWRLHAHSRVASMLEDRGATAAARAPHIERSAQFGDVMSATVLMQAGQELMFRSPASAAHWFEIALELTPAQDEHLGLRSGLMAQHAMALGFAGQLEAARDEARRVLAHTPVELRQQATILCVGLELLLGAHADARGLLLDRLAGLEDQRGRDAAELKCELASTHFFDADWQASAHWAKEALACDCEGMTKVGALALLAVAEFGLDRLRPAQQAASEAAACFERLDDMEVAARSAATIFLAQGEIHTERFADAARHLERSIAIARASGQRLLTVGLLAAQIQALTALGRVTELAIVAETATEEALLSSSEVILSMATSTRAMAGILTGDLHSALRFANRSASLLSAASPVAGGGQLALAWVLLEIGDPAGCRRQLTRSDGEPRLPSAPLLEGFAYELLIAAELALGNLARAQELAFGCCEAARRRGTNVPIAVSQRALARVSLRGGDTQAALAAALRSCEAAEKAGARLEAGRSQILLGSVLAAGGEQSAAIATLRAAHETLNECGAFHYRDEAAKELRKLGRYVPRGNGSASNERSVLGLTGREREVMEHVATGKTNREIADSLFLSPRTIDRHLARIFEKLGVHSRAAATSAFERGRTDPGS
jgi:DNA-binding CsgD family transcriptional regulator